jgi:hypothetical protein
MKYSLKSAFFVIVGIALVFSIARFWYVRSEPPIETFRLGTSDNQSGVLMTVGLKKGELCFVLIEKWPDIPASTKSTIFTGNTIDFWERLCILVGDRTIACPESAVLLVQVSNKVISTDSFKISPFELECFVKSKPHEFSVDELISFVRKNGSMNLQSKNDDSKIQARVGPFGFEEVDAVADRLTKEGISFDYDIYTFWWLRLRSNSDQSRAKVIAELETGRPVDIWFERAKNKEEEATPVPPRA